MINFACFLTCLRIILTPLVVGLMVHDMWVSAFIVFLAAAFTDLVDGFVARRFNQQSRLGQILDPVADKILFTSVMLTLMFQMRSYQIVFYCFGFLLCKEIILLVGGSILWFGYQKFIPPSFLSRAVSLAEVALIVLVFLLQAAMLLHSWILPVTVCLCCLNVVMSCLLLLRYAKIVIFGPIRS